MKGGEQATTIFWTTKTGMKLSVRGADDGDQVLFEGKSDGDDPDIIIPPRLSIYLVYSAHLLLVTSIVAIVYAVVFHWELLYGVSGLCFCLYCTSVVHWYEPRFSSLARRADYAAVACTLALASYVATTLTLTYILIWYVGIACIGLVFAVNEYLYYYQVMRRISGASGGSGKG